MTDNNRCPTGVHCDQRSQPGEVNMSPKLARIDELEQSLCQHPYVADRALATAIFLMLKYQDDIDAVSKGLLERILQELRARLQAQDQVASAQKAAGEFSASSLCG